MGSRMTLTLAGVLPVLIALAGLVVLRRRGQSSAMIDRTLPAGSVNHAISGPSLRET